MLGREPEVVTLPDSDYLLDAAKEHWSEILMVYRNFEGVIGRYDDVPRLPHECDRCHDREHIPERGLAKLLNRTADRFEPPRLEPAGSCWRC